MCSTRGVLKDDQDEMMMSMFYTSNEMPAVNEECDNRQQYGPVNTIGE